MLGGKEINRLKDFLEYYFLNIILCNDVITITTQAGDVHFHGSSTDEMTLVEAARKLGYDLR